jgi:hypothetical protein
MGEEGEGHQPFDWRSRAQTTRTMAFRGRRKRRKRRRERLKDWVIECEEEEEEGG